MAYTTIKKPSSYFNTKLYTGNGSTQSITGVSFQPDFIWIKNRSSAYSNCLYDIVRTATKRLKSNSTDGEDTDTNGLTAFDLDGFSVGSSASQNASGENIVSWNWLASNTTASNTDGSISSTVSVNTTSGFSIVSYTGTGATATIGHGLGVAPAMIIVKQTNVSRNWPVGHNGIGWTKYLYLDSTQASTTGNLFNDTAPTNLVFSVINDGGVNASGGSYIAYCFADVQGFSKFGSYTGNGNANGTFVYTGFKPAMFIVKNTTTLGNGWQIFDSKRAGYNTSNLRLSPSDAGAEDTTTGYFDILSNGFKIRSTNDFNNKNGDTYIYMAFAEEPLVGDNPATAR